MPVPATARNISCLHREGPPDVVEQNVGFFDPLWENHPLEPISDKLCMIKMMRA